MATEEKQWAVVRIGIIFKAVKIKRRTENRLIWESGDSWKWSLLYDLYGVFPTKTLATVATKRGIDAIKRGEHDRRIRSIVKSCVGYSK